MKIVIDARLYGLENAGIGRYLINLINQIEKIDKRNHYFLLLRKKYFEELNFKNKNWQKVLSDYPHYSFQEQLLLPLQLLKLKPDLVHFSHFNVPLFWWGKYVVTIHDLIKHESRGMKTTTHLSSVYWLKYVVYLFVVWLTVKKAAKIITPSKFWQEELAKRYALPKDKIIVTYEGVDESLKPQDKNSENKNILAKYKIKKPFVVYTGSLYPHKNVERLAEAVGRLNQNLKLVIICVRNVFYERFLVKIKKMGLSKSVNLVGFVPDEEIAAIYQQAEVFVFPSLWEGFGLPGLEAMGLGLPVLAAKASCLPEIYGEAALYFNPHKTDDLVKKIKRVREDKKLREELVRKGLEQVKKYSWEKTAKETLLVYNSFK
ncbi:glycosyltransferase family 4 protein [Patescibacteria group bacterium]|nr:glycosyltransferase family 4 protein [Patescibacteria group bacterium]